MVTDPPKRATASVTLTFGTSLIPVQLFSGQESTDNRWVKRSEYTRDGRSCGRARVVKDTDPPEIVTDFVKCVETDEGLVELTDDEIAEALDLPEEEAEILTFLPLHVMGSGRYLPEAILQVRPAKGKQKGSFDPAAAKAFATLMKAMRQKQVFALVQLVLQRRPTYGALLPNGRMYKLMFDDEVRDDRPMPDVNVSMEKVDQVIEAMNISNEPPELTNDHRDLITAYVEKKAKEGQTIDNEETATPPDEEEVEDLLANLRRSVGDSS